jgi:hypothetical protein
MPLQLLYSELYHYYSHIWKLAIIIVSLPDSYHFICLKQHRTHLQIVVFSYSPKYPFNSLYSMTCRPTQSSPSSHLPTVLPGALNRHRHHSPGALRGGIAARVQGYLDGARPRGRQHGCGSPPGTPGQHDMPERAA